MYISSSRTADEWTTFRKTLEAGAGTDQWQVAIVEYFHDRLETRYLLPIRAIQSCGRQVGEGFSMMTIQCALLEFLESTVQGKSYRFDAPAGSNREYSSSSAMFKSFLTRREPFRNLFTESVAEDFYRNVRCGLLHEAQTKRGWTIAAHCRAQAIIDADSKIVYRDNFFNALQLFITRYEQELLVNPNLQEAFIAKFDGLAAP